MLGNLVVAELVLEGVDYRIACHDTVVYALRGESALNVVTTKDRGESADVSMQCPCGNGNRTIQHGLFH